MDRLHVDLNENSYDIVFTDSFDNLADEVSSACSPQKILIVTDTNVSKIYALEVQAELNKTGAQTKIYEIKAGEENKNIEGILGICHACMEFGLDRNSMIAALGGGVVGDMSGFAAAIYMRGISFIQIPTTLLAQSDSSVGGKTGVDFEDSKNILGAFHQPKMVYINVNTLKTLPYEQIVSGMGEIIKHGVIRDKEFFEYIKSNKDRIQAFDTNTLVAMSKKNCTIKAEVVMKDEKESGLRAILNFGHTIGHAVESAFDFSFTHGECVGLGMIAASYISKQRGIFSEANFKEIEDILLEYGFKIKVKLPEYDKIMKFIKNDKKKISGKIKFILPETIGSVFQKTDITDAEICLALDYINEI